VRNFIICSHPQISLGNQVKANEVGRSCGTNGRGERSIQGFGGKARITKSEIHNRNENLFKFNPWKPKLV
jgi:hypothetical protein